MKSLPKAVISINQESIEFKQSLLNVVGEDKVLKALVDAILLASGFPMASIVTTGIQGVLSYMLQDRTRNFLKKLASFKGKLDENLINKHEFVHKFVITYRAVLQTYNLEKIECFAQLFYLANTGENEKIISVNEYEDMLNILFELTDVEMCVLVLLDKFETGIAGYASKSPYEKSKSNTFWDEFIDAVRHKISEEDIIPRLNRIQRTGLYQQFGPLMTDDIGYLTPSGNADGYLTSLYYKLKRYALTNV